MSEQFYRGLDAGKRRRLEQKAKDNKKIYEEKQKQFHADGASVVSQNIQETIESRLIKSKPIKKIYSPNSKVRKVNI